MKKSSAKVNIENLIDYLATNYRNGKGTMLVLIKMKHLANGTWQA
jgi:hypothetical protein